MRRDNQYHIVQMGDGREVPCHVCLIATGVSYCKLDIPGADQLTGSGVYYGAALAEAKSCAEEIVYIVGGANSAGQAAMYFSRYAGKVHMLVRGDSLTRSMSKYLIDQIAATPNITVETCTEIASMSGNGHLECLTLKTPSGEERRQATSVFIFIGADTKTDWLPKHIALESKGVETITPQLFAQLRKVPIFWSLKDDELHCVEGVGDIHLGKDEFLVRQGEAAHFFWILLEGEIRVFQSQSDGHDGTIYKIESGNAFGEVPLLANIPNGVNLQTTMPSHLLQLDEEQFWSLMTSCPQVRKAILTNMSQRFQKMQSMTLQQEKMVSLGTLAAGLMHELNNPRAAARRAAQQVRENLMRMHELSIKFKERDLTKEQKHCMVELQEQALAVKQPLRMNSLEQSDAEEALAERMESNNIENAWKMAPTLVSIGMDAKELASARNEFQ